MTSSRRYSSRWKREDLFARTLRAAEGKPSFVFFEGPPTANGKPGIHHVFSRTIKDLFCRHRAMKGFYVARKSRMGHARTSRRDRSREGSSASAASSRSKRSASRNSTRSAARVLAIQVRLGDAERANRVLARLRPPIRHLHQRIHRERVVGAHDAVTSAIFCIAVTRFCRTARAAARRCRATKSRRARRT